MDPIVHLWVVRLLLVLFEVMVIIWGITIFRLFNADSEVKRKKCFRNFLIIGISVLVVDIILIVLMFL